MNKTILMPSELTAENGAKYLMIGEFKESILVNCYECGGDFEAAEECEECSGAGEYLIDVPISWDTIKSIYQKAADNLKIDATLKSNKAEIILERFKVVEEFKNSFPSLLDVQLDGKSISIAELVKYANILASCLNDHGVVFKVIKDKS